MFIKKTITTANFMNGDTAKLTIQFQYDKNADGIVWLCGYGDKGETIKDQIDFDEMSEKDIRRAISIFKEMLSLKRCVKKSKKKAKNDTVKNKEIPTMEGTRKELDDALDLGTDE